MQSKAVALGALEVIVASMRAHPSHAGIQENGAAALGNLSAHPSNHERARECGAMEVSWVLHILSVLAACLVIECAQLTFDFLS